MTSTGYGINRSKNGKIDSEVQTGSVKMLPIHKNNSRLPTPASRLQQIEIPNFN